MILINLYILLISQYLKLLIFRFFWFFIQDFWVIRVRRVKKRVDPYKKIASHRLFQTLQLSFLFSDHIRHFFDFSLIIDNNFNLIMKHNRSKYQKDQSNDSSKDPSQQRKQAISKTSVFQSIIAKNNHYFRVFVKIIKKFY